MYDKEKQNVTLNIAGEQVKTVINRSEEEELRKIEKQVTGLWKQWKQMNPSKTDSQVLAMVAFPFCFPDSEKKPTFVEIWVRNG